MRGGELMRQKPRTVQRKVTTRKTAKRRNQRRAGEAERRAARKASLRLTNYLLEPHPELGT